MRVTEETGRAATSYQHDYDAEVFYLGLALDPAYVEGSLERIGEDDPDGEGLLRDIWEEGDDREFVMKTLQSGVEVGAGRPEDYLPY